MTNNKITHKNYNNNYNVYQLVLPVDKGILIPENDSVRLLSQVMEELDYTILMKAYSTKGKRKTKLQRYIESIEDVIEKQSKYDGYNNTFDGRNSFSKTDKDATFMHMKEDHGFRRFFP